MSRLVLPIVVALGLVLVGCGGAGGGEDRSVASRGETVDGASSGAEAAAPATAPSAASPEGSDETAVAARQADSESDSEPARGPALERRE